MKKYMIFVILAHLMTSCILHQPQKISPKTEYVVTNSTEGLIDCFEPTWDSLKNRWTFCELSAAVVYENEILTASDKSIPLNSSVLKLQLNDGKIKTQPITNLNHPLLKTASKFEDFSISPDQKHIFLSTGFDRLKKDGWDDYNCLFAWPVTQIDKIQLLEKSKRQTLESSISLRKKIQAALADNNYPNGPEYFKVEGLAVAPNQQLIFGIREMGKRYDDFQYKIILLSISYQIQTNGNIELGENMQKIYEFNPSRQKYPTLQLPIALSSIEYSPYHNQFYITTSFEHEERLGAYLWTISPKELEKGDAPNLVKTTSNKIFEMKHKAEAVSIINKNKLLIVHDDDRELINGRAPHQSAYHILNVNVQKN